MSFLIARTIVAIAALMVPAMMTAPSFGAGPTRVAEYNFDITYQTVTKAGEPVEAMTIDGGIPGPTIEATLGDTLRVTFNNKMDVETSIHWHGVLLPPDQDGVPGLNTRPIGPGESFTFQFPVRHAGTYWYHSHTGLQEQRGVYGSIVFHEADRSLEQRVPYDREQVLVFSDWTNDDPDRVLTNLKRDGDYYALQKGSVQSWLGVLKNGRQAIRNRLDAAWSRMGTMDLSDIGYDAFLANGVPETRIAAKPSERIRLRIINAAASSYFDLQFAAGPMTVIAADGVDVEPLEVARLRIAVAETYDVIVTIPRSGASEFRATSIDGTGYASAVLGRGTLTAAPDIARPNLYLMGMGSMDMGKMEMGEMEMDKSASPSVMDMSAMTSLGAIPTLEHMVDYSALRATASTTFDATRPVRDVELTLTGNMERYVWSFGTKTLSEADTIKIKKGEIVRFRLVNKTMMSHPLHLHGHFFRVLNGQGDRSPLKHTVDVPPMQTVVIEFAANEERDWFFHCHMLYHMKTGMARVVSYQDTSQATKPIISRLTSDRHPYAFADLAAQSNMLSGRLWAVKGRYGAEILFDYDWKRAYEFEASVSRNLNRFLDVYVGVSLEEAGATEEKVGTLGVRYILPLLIEANLSIESNGDLHLELESELQLTDRIEFGWHWDSENDYRLELEYEITKGISVVGNYDSDYDFGAGLMAKF